MKKFARLKLLMLFVGLSSIVFAQNNFWSDLPEARLGNREQDRKIIPNAYRALHLDTAQLKTFLATTPMEFSPTSISTPSIFSIPMPDGSTQRFEISEAPMMEPALAAKFPEIRTYGGQGIDDRYATIKIDWTPNGFHAMILSPVSGSVFIDPYVPGEKSHYISYFKKDLTPKYPLVEEGEITGLDGLSDGAVFRTQGLCIGGTLRTYRLAVACTGEYARVIGGTAVTKAQALAAIVTTTNRVNGIYEKELSIRLTLVGNNDIIVFTDPAADPFTGNNSAGVLIGESQTVITNNILSANFDIGHTFSTGAGGLASLAVVCNDGSKARGVTGSAQPFGDPYDVDYVAHEIGHQFGGSHSFNATTGGCGGGNRAASAAAEPGSGSTIMAYAGLCTENNLQNNSDAVFHAISFNQITNFSAGSFCGTQTATGNTPPTANAGLDYTIPRSTPFALTGTGSDVNGDALTYSWEQIDVNAPAGSWNAPSGNAPIFRTFLPVTSPTRIFPRMTNIVNNNQTIGEILPAYGRTINFRMTVRDNRSGGGGVCSDEMVVTVNGAAGPFLVTYPNTNMALTGANFYTITWDVAGTNVAPINTANVSIDLSTDGGFTFPINLVASTPNDGSHEIALPNISSSQARVRVKAINNVYFDISNANFSISTNPNTEFVFNQPATVFSCDGLNLSTTLLTNAVNGYSTPITLSATDNPAGTTVSFSQNPIAPGGSAVVTLQGTVPAGSYTIQVNGTSGAINKSQNLTFAVGPPPGVPNLNSPGNNTTGVSPSPNFTWTAVPGAGSYDLQVATDNNFTSIVHSGNDIVGTVYAIPAPLAENTEYYWRVRPKNSCGGGSFSNTSRFKTYLIACPTDTAYSTDVPKIISAASPNIITSTLNITSGGAIADVDVVGVKGTHDYMGDLTFSISSPAGSTAVLMDEACGSTDNFDLSFNDQAPAGPYSCPPINGQVRIPLQSLSQFNLQNSVGTWTLRIEDGYSDDGGELQRWGLRICTYSSTPLPVNWLQFTAQKSGNQSVSLLWQTANEVNNKYYEIEKSRDGINFITLGTVEAASNPATTNQYIFNDLKPYSGANFYRLKQVDIDGRFTYSKIVKITFDTKEALWSVYPNPAVDVTNIRVLNDMKKVTIRLTDGAGKVMLVKSAPVINAGELVEIPVQGLAKGLYIITVTSDKGTAIEKLMVK